MLGGLLGTKVGGLFGIKPGGGLVAIPAEDTLPAAGASPAAAAAEVAWAALGHTGVARAVPGHKTLTGPKLGEKAASPLGGGSHQYSALDPLQHKALHRQAQKAC